MPILINKKSWLGVGALAALALWFWLTPGADHSESTRVNEAAPDAAGALRHAESAESTVTEIASTEAPNERGSDPAWNPGGPSEPTVEDVQQWGWLVDDLDRLIDETRPKARRRLDAGDFARKYLRASLEYLKLDEEEGVRFETAVREGLKAIEEAREEMHNVRAATAYEEAQPRSIQVWKDSQGEFLRRQKEAAHRIVASLPVRPRTTLMREQALRWILRCDFGIRHASRPPRL